MQNASKITKHPEWKTFRYVPHFRVGDFLKAGWHATGSDLGHHNEYSILMEWLCDCKINEPTITWEEFTGGHRYPRGIANQ